MNSSYLEYLKCYCNSDQFSIYQYKNNKLEIVLTTNNEKTIRIGLLTCNDCHSWYPIDEGILYMLPNSLAEHDKDKFIKKYNIVLPVNYSEKVKKVVNRHEEEKESIFHKKNEMEVRDKQADIYHTYGYKIHDLNEKRHFMEFLGPSTKDIIVELGCGTGRITEEIIRRGFLKYIAIDFSERSLQILSNKLNNELKRGILLIKADVCYVPLKNQIANKVLSAQVFEHIPGCEEQHKFIKSLYRILSSNGLAALTIYNYNLRKRLSRNKDRQKGFHNGKIYYENFELKRVEKLFKPYFKIERLYGINCYLPFITRVNEKIQQVVEFILARSFFSRYLGNILFVGLRKSN